MTLQAPIAPPPSTDEQLPLAEEHHGYRSVLKNKNFLALWVGQIFSQIADRIIFVVFIALIVQYYGPSDRYNSYLYIAFTIPAILLTAIAGVFVDRWPRRALLVSSNLLRAAFVAMLPLAASSGTEWVLFAVAFMISVATQFFVPAEAATIPMIVSKPQLTIANSLFTTTMMASVIFGFALGDPLINIFSLKQVHWSIVGLFLLASVILMLVKIPKVQSDDDSLRGEFKHLVEDMKDGLTYIAEHKMVLQAMFKLAVLFSTVVAVCILMISLAKAFLFDDPKVAAQKFAYIITFSGIGMALGAVWVGSQFRNHRRGYLVYGGFITVGLCLSLLAGVSVISKVDHAFYFPKLVTDFVYLDEVHVTFRMVYTYVLAILMGVGAAFVTIPLQSFLHELIPDDKRGRVMGVQFTMLSTCSTLPVLIAGMAVEYIGVQWMLLMIGLPLLMLGLIGLQQRLAANRPGSEHVLIANW